MGASITRTPFLWAFPRISPKAPTINHLLRFGGDPPGTHPWPNRSETEVGQEPSGARILHILQIFSQLPRVPRASGSPVPRVRLVRGPSFEVRPEGSNGHRRFEAADGGTSPGQPRSIGGHEGFCCATGMGHVGDSPAKGPILEQKGRLPRPVGGRGRSRASRMGSQRSTTFWKGSFVLFIELELFRFRFLFFPNTYIRITRIHIARTMPC